MSTWKTPVTATLKARLDESNDWVSFPGVASDNAAGTPENFLDAINNILYFAGAQALKAGMTRTTVQEVSE